MYNVLPMGTQDERLHIRVKPDLKEDSKVLAEIRGLTLSALIHFLLAREVQEARKNDPAEFERVRKRLSKEASHHGSPKILKAS
ncbi:MAG TPA: hypothetical protein VF297_05020 [Pyrinomonadaceae bacterium]